ncbi:MAG: hypothetical protein LC798_12625 [Chloroflexi bacterium]|nr:hypothetical protein [Chloroflexota bacterium]
MFRLSAGRPDPYGRGTGGEWIIEAEETFDSGVMRINAEQPPVATGYGERAYVGISVGLSRNRGSTLLVFHSLR